MSELVKSYKGIDFDLLLHFVPGVRGTEVKSSLSELRSDLCNMKQEHVCGTCLIKPI